MATCRNMLKLCIFDVCGNSILRQEPKQTRESVTYNDVIVLKRLQPTKKYSCKTTSYANGSDMDMQSLSVQHDTLVMPLCSPTPIRVYYSDFEHYITSLGTCYTSPFAMKLNPNAREFVPKSYRT